MRAWIGAWLERWRARRARHEEPACRDEWAGLPSCPECMSGELLAAAFYEPARAALRRGG